jgi:surface antigen
LAQKCDSIVENLGQLSGDIKMTSKIIVAALAAATVAGCANDPYSPKQDSGAVAGAIAGGALGALAGGRGAGNRLAGAVVGAAAGGLLGSAIGASLDEQDRQRAYAAEMAALESGAPGAPVGWRGDRPTYYGTVVPGPYYVSRGMRCRAYTHTVYIDGRPQAMRGTACRNPDGTWTAVG